MLKQMLAAAAVAACLATGVSAQDVFYPGNGVTLPTVIREVKPTLTGTGTALLECVVRADGTVGEVVVSRSTGEPRLDDGAVAAVTQWRFKPGMKAGKPVAVRIALEIQYRMR